MVDFAQVRTTKSQPFVVAKMLEQRARGPYSSEPALQTRQEDWTVADLAAHAVGVVRSLGATGCALPATVGVLVDDAADSVAAVFGAYWAGCGVVPLDPTEPLEHQRAILDRAGVELLLDPTGSLPDDYAGRVVVRPGPAVRDVEQWPAPTSVRSDAPGTIVFTSGSTGRPKGVFRTVADTNISILSTFESPAWNDTSRVAVLLPLRFAAGLNGVIASVASGRLAILLRPASMSAVELGDALRSVRADKVLLTPSLLRSLATGELLPLPDLREIRATGEPLMWEDVALARRGFGPCNIATQYGASEGLGYISVHIVGPNDPIGVGRTPIGRPSNRSGISLDTSGRSDGSGELVYRGEVATGYLDDPELQQARFGVDTDGARTWRSGDLVIVDADGVMHHRGRIDDMVKINGQLVEPAEAEAALRTIEGVRNAAVRIGKSSVGRQQLVGHVETSRPMEPAVIVAALRGLLPTYLVPSRILIHERLPLTDRGKVDGARLDELAAEARAASNGSSHRTGGLDFLLETVLTTARELIADNLGPDDNIWDAGCDSLTAIQLLNELVGNDRESLDAADLLNVSTCRDLADCLRSQQRRVRSHVVALNAEATRQPLVLVSGGGAFALGYRPLTNEIGDLHPIVIYEQSGLQSRARRDRSVEAAAMRNLCDLRTRQPHGPYVIAGHSWGGVVAHEMVRQLELHGEPSWLVLMDASRHRPAPPDAIRNRRDSRFIWTLKYAKWRLVRLGRAVGDVCPFLKPPIGSLKRYDLFYRHAVRTMRRLAIAPISSPVLLVYPTGSSREFEWDDHPNLRKVAVGGDHHTMLWYPHVIEVAAALRSVVESAQTQTPSQTGR